MKKFGWLLAILLLLAPSTAAATSYAVEDCSTVASPVENDLCFSTRGSGFWYLYFQGAWRVIRDPVFPVVGAAGGTSSADGAGYSAGTTPGTPVIGARDDAAIAACGEDKLCIGRVTEFRALHVNLRDAAGVEVAVGGGTQYDQGTAGTTTDKLTMAGCTRSDTPAVPAGVVDGDRVRCIVDATGRMWIHVSTIDGGTITTITNPVTVAQSTATNLKAEVIGTGTFATQIVQGGLTATVRDTGTSDSLNVAIVDGSGAQITTFGGGTQYTEGDIDTTITGTAMMWEDASDTLRAVSTAKPLPVAQQGTVTVTGTTFDGIVKDGTGDTTQANVSTGRLHVDGSGVTQPISAASLPLPTGASTLAEQQTQTTALQLIDDTVATTASAITTKGIAAAGTDGTNARILKTDTSGELQIDVLTSALPTGAATLAEQQTQTTALQLIDNLPVTQGSTTSGQSGVLTQGAVTTSAPTYTTGQTSPLSLDTAGALRVTGAGGGTQYAVDTALGATPTGTLAIGIRDDALSTLTPVEGDAIGLRVNERGALWTAWDHQLDKVNDSITIWGSDDAGTTKRVIKTDAGGAIQVDCESGCSGGAQYTEDVAAATDPVGNALIVVRNDGRTGSLTTTDGDNVALRGTNAGELYVSSNTAQINGVTPLMGNGVTGTGSQRVTIASDNTAFSVNANAGTNLNTSALSLEATQGSVLTSVQLQDDTVHATNAALGKATAIAGQLDDAATTAATENNVASIRITAQRAAHANLRNDAGTEIGTSGAPIRTDPTGSTTQPISAASLPLPTGAATSANQDGIIKDGAGDTTQANVTSGRLNVDGSGVTQPVSGTVTANAGTGTRDVQHIGLSLGATFQTAVTGTAAQLASNTGKVVCMSVKDGGTQTVYWGNSSGVTTSTGQELLPGASMCRPFSNSNQIWIIASTTGSTVAVDVTN